MNQETTEIQKTDILSRIRLLGRKIGGTPLLKLSESSSNPEVEIWAKAEWNQLSGSVKARAAYYIVREAIESGKLNSGNTLLDASSGNTAIAYAYLAHELGIPLTICLPENASSRRKEILKSLGTTLIYTSRFGGTDEAQEVAQELADSQPERYFYANQYKNPNNVRAHYEGTAVEIIQELPQLTHFVAGLGTTGTFTGTASRLLEYNSNISVVALQPDLALHGLEGWKHLETAKIPEIFNSSLAQNTLAISTEKAYAQINETFQKENLLLSPSAAANLAGARELAQQLDRGKIVTIFPDSSDRYPELIDQLKNL